jgi:hypothetical protein
MTKRNDYFLLCAEIVVRDGEHATKHRRMNTVVELERPFVSEAVLEQARKETLIRLNKESGLTAELVLDFVFLSISHLGRGSREEFMAVDQPSPAAPSGKAAKALTFVN